MLNNILFTKSSFNSSICQTDSQQVLKKWKYRQCVKENMKDGYDWSATRQRQTAFCVCQREHWECWRACAQSGRQSKNAPINSWDLTWNLHSPIDCAQNNSWQSPAQVCQYVGEICHFLCSVISEGKAVALHSWCGKWNHLSMTHRLTADYAKIYWNWTLIVHVILENVVTFFLGHSVLRNSHLQLQIYPIFNFK